MDRQLKIDRTVNLNTIIALCGFLIVIVGGIFTLATVYSKLQNQADAWVEFQKRQEGYNVNLDADRKAARVENDVKLDAIVQTITKLTALGDQTGYQIAQLQKKDDENDARLGRMSESYSNKFTEIQTTLSGMSTQLALQSQALIELKQIIVPNRTSVK